MSNAKRPLSSKKTPTHLKEPDFFQDRFSLSEEVKKEIEAQNLEYRFIDYKKYVNEGGVHRFGWTVYRVKNQPKESFLIGQNPDGIIRRGSTVLATRPKSYGDKHRDYLEQKNRIYKGFKAQKAAELRDKARNSGAVIDESYDDDETE